MNFLTLCQTARQECGVQGQGPSVVTDQTGVLKKIIDWVVKADIYIQSLHSDWDFLQKDFTSNTIIDSDAITRPTIDFGMWDRESFALDRGTSNGRGLILIDYKEWRKNNNLKTSNYPYSVTILPNGNLALGAPADGIYELYANYWQSPVTLATDDQLPLYADRFHWVIIERVKMYYYADQEAFELYKEAEMRFKEWLEKLEGFALPGQQFRTQGQPDLMAVRPV